jgi:superfamily II DNA or RNA helicase
MTALPTQGQLVEVRQRQFVVLDVRQSALEADPLRTTPLPNGGGPARREQHLVTLSSLEDDALGEELQVVWELEPGARAYERAALPAPTGFDAPRRLDAFLDAVRWGAVSSADMDALQAPFRSGIEVQDYQLDPVARALRMPRVNLLIADDVGLGKTIEAGLVLQELLLRHRARTVLVICPADIQIQWRDEMRDKFGLEFRIVDSELMKSLRRQRGLHVNPWTHFPRLITSIDFLKRERPLRLFRETLPAPGEPAFPRRYDLLIVDEAHNIAPSGVGQYATDSLRTAAVRELAPHFEHKLFLSATPHNGYPESFSALLELLDNQRFARSVPPDREQLGAVMIRRLKSELPADWDGSRRFPERRLEAIEVPYTTEERRAHRALQHYTELRRAGAGSEAEKYATEFVLKLLKKRLFSSPQAFLTTLEKHQRSLESGGRQTPLAARRAPGILRRQVEETEEQQADDQTYEESIGDVLVEATRFFRAPDAAEKALLRELHDWATFATARGDTKADALLQWLQENLKPGGQWSDRRVIIFTEYRATQNWLQGLFSAVGLAGGGRLEVLYGGMHSDERERIKAAFQASPADAPVRILLATDAASEGINLQNHCSHLVHYEIPWNPNRLEQRNGRIDRHGQRADAVMIYHFVGAGYAAREGTGVATAPGDLEGDLEFLLRAARKVENIREDLGKVGPVIASQVEEAMLGRRRTLDTTRAEADANPVRQMLKFERDLKKQLQTLYDQLQASRQELRLSPENVRAVVDIGLELAGQPPLREACLADIWPDRSGRRTICPVFTLPLLTGAWSACAQGLAHPHTGQTRPITFDHSLAEGRDDVVLAHLNHRLVGMCLRLLRAEIWAGADRKGLHRVAARLVPSDTLDTPAVIAHGRLVVLGGDSQRLHEEIVIAGGALREGRFARLNVSETKQALDAALDAEPPEHIKARLASLWSNIAEPLLRALEARMRDRTGGLERLMQERAAKEAGDIATILRELERAIRTELDAGEPQQLELWTDTEKEQLQRNKASLRARAESIPAEIDREVEAIRLRYADPRPRLFPAAVTFLVPERLAH